jgi:hypothetical protein
VRWGPPEASDGQRVHQHRQAPEHLDDEDPLLEQRRTSEGLAESVEGEQGEQHVEAGHEALIDDPPRQPDHRPERQDLEQLP